MFEMSRDSLKHGRKKRSKFVEGESKFNYIIKRVDQASIQLMMRN